MGFGHLQDARRLTSRLGGDPDKWVDVKKHLPLLGEEKWYTKTRYGYARGQEPVDYVENIRRYYDLHGLGRCAAAAGPCDRAGRF